MFFWWFSPRLSITGDFDADGGNGDDGDNDDSDGHGDDGNNYDEKKEGDTDEGSFR